MHPGERLGAYEVLAPIGAGGMGEVYRARDTRLGREVAVKMLPAEYAHDPERLKRFKQEARAAAALNHPHIVTIYSVEEVDGVHFLTMELVEGQTLDKFIPQGGMPAERVVQIGAALADALAAAHDRGIVHRDLKPANVMVTGDGRVKVLDFGLAKVSVGKEEMDATVSRGLTQPGTVVGTVPYMSPEQVSGRPVDPRTDIFSLGVILYEIASGRRPFEGSSSAELVSAILRDTPRPLGELRADLPAALAEIVQRCLVKDAGGRPQSTRELRDLLLALSPGRESGRPPAQAAIAREERLHGNLPSAVDSFVAREEELAEVVARLEDARLLTLVGAGGTGKTRLATESASRLAGRFAGGAWLVELAPVMQAETVPYLVADLIGAVPQPGKTVVRSIVDSLRNRSLLLVLDNCEHVLEAAAELASAITAHCDGVRILATSRENLAIRGEHVIRLPSLSDHDGAVLFRDRARAAGVRTDLDLKTLARLSRRLDGMPLAIELAAARCGAMSPEQIEQRLDDRFRLLRGSRRGRIERHQTLRNTVAWSYELLEHKERRVFDRLSAFAGGFTLEAAQAVAGGDDIDDVDVEEAVSALVTRSMVLAVDTGDDTRYRLLETLRQFGEERLAQSGDAARVRDRHVRYFAGFMRQAWVGLWSADDPRWIRAVGREFENLRLAVYTAIDSRDRSAVEGLIKPHLWWAWQSLRYEVGDWAEAALTLSPEPAYARPVAIHLSMHGGRPEHVALLATKLGKPEDVPDPDAAWMTALGHCDASIISGSPESRRWISLGAELAQRAGSPAQAAAVKSLQVVFKVMAGEMDEARRIAAEAHREAVTTGNQIALCWTCFFMGRAHSDADPTLALDYFDRSAEIAERIGIPLLAGIAATEAAVVIARFEEPSRACPRLARALRAIVDSGDLRQLWTSAHHLAYFLIRAGRSDDALSIWRELGGRQAFAAQHHRDELKQLLGEPGKGALSDDELLARIREMLDGLDAGVL
jgi:non-specific serine/threonine protein kinase